MISYITLLSFSVLTLGQPPIWTEWSLDSAREAFENAYAAVLTSRGIDTADRDDELLAMASPRVVFQANCGPVSIDDVEKVEDEIAADLTPTSDESFVGPRIEEPDLDPIETDDMEPPQTSGDDEFASPMPMLDSDELVVMPEEALDSSTHRDSIIRLAVAGDDLPPDEPRTNDDTPGDDFQDFGGSFSYRTLPEKAAEPTKTDKATNPETAPEEGINISTNQPVTAASAQATGVAPVTGLSADLRQRIGITRMTLKDQPADLIRVAVNSSIVVDLSGPVDEVNIVDPKIAEVIVPKADRVIVVGKETGTTQLVLKFGEDHRVFHVLVEPNLVVLTSLIRSLAPRSDIKLATVNGQIVLQGFVSDPETARQIAELAKAYQQGREVINHLSVAGTQQTMLRVVVAEVNKEALRNLGFNWAIGGADWSRDFFFANNVGQLNPTAFSSSGLGNVLAGQMNYGVSPTANGANTNVTFGFPKAEMQVFLNALRQNGLARLLAEPNLVAISGQTATFLAGGEVPIPVSQGGAVAGAITIEYKEFGVRLAFTPTVCADQIVRLHVMTEVSDAVAGARQIDTIPVFTFRTRRVESTIECPNGQTFAIAGLLNEQVNAVAQKIPGLGDVPVIGALFNSVDYQKSNTEMVVLVTPQLVEALDPQQVVPVPGQNMRHPNDFELFALSELEGRPYPAPSRENDEDSNEPGEGTLVRRSRPAPAQARLQGIYGFEDREPGALSN